MEVVGTDVYQHGGWKCSDPRVLPSQDAHLMPQANELEFQGGAATKAEGVDGNDGG